MSPTEIVERYISGLIDELKASFALEELQGFDAFGPHGTTYDASDAFIAAVRGQTWASVSSDFLEYEAESLFFIAPSSYPKYLPMFLYVVTTEFDTRHNVESAVLTGLTRYTDDAELTQAFDGKVSHLTTIQARATAKILQYLEVRIREAHDDPFYHWIDDRDNRATIALNVYWRQFLD